METTIDVIKKIYNIFYYMKSISVNNSSKHNRTANITVTLAGTRCGLLY